MTWTPQQRFIYGDGSEPGAPTPWSLTSRVGPPTDDSLLLSIYPLALSCEVQILQTLHTASQFAVLEGVDAQGKHFTFKVPDAHLSGVKNHPELLLRL